MNIANGTYTESQLLAYLRSPTRKVKYEYLLLSAGDVLLGSVDIKDAQISYDSESDVMRQFSGELQPTSLISDNVIDYKLIPYMVLTIGNDEVRWPLGRFIISLASTSENGLTTHEITGYDLGKILLDDAVTDKNYIPAGAIYTSNAQGLIENESIECNVEDSTKTTSADKEWDIGTSKIEIINELLEAISYDPLYFDEYGAATSTEHIDDADRDIDITYSTDDNSIILDSITIESNAFDIPNKFVRYTEDADDTYYISSYTNDSESSPCSTVNRGRTIVDIDTVEDIASQADLDNYVLRLAQESTQSAETITFTTMNMPGAGYRDCILLNVPEYNLVGRCIETSWTMDLEEGTTEHTVRKVVIW